MTLDEYLEELDAQNVDEEFIENRVEEIISQLPALRPLKGHSIHCYHCNADRKDSFTFYYAWDSETDTELFTNGYDYQLACSVCIGERVQRQARSDLQDMKDSRGIHR